MRSLDIRLRKIEAALPPEPPDPIRFWIFGHDKADLDQRIATAMAAGHVEDCETPFQVIWRGDELLPPARWMRGGELSQGEEEDWFATVLETIGGQAHPRGGEGAFLNMLTVIEALRAEIGRRDTGAPARGTAAEIGMRHW